MAIFLLGVLALLLGGLLAFGLTRHTKPTPTPSIVAPTAISPSTTARTLTTEISGKGKIDVGSFSSRLPAGLTDITRTDSGGLHTLNFNHTSSSGSVGVQPKVAGESLQQLASIYGNPKTHKISGVSGGVGYMFTTLSGGRYSVIIIGRAKGQDIVVHLAGPASQIRSAKSLAKRIASGIAVNR